MKALHIMNNRKVYIYIFLNIFIGVTTLYLLLMEKDLIILLHN